MKDYDTAATAAFNARLTHRVRVTQIARASRRIGGKDWNPFCLCVTAENCPCDPIIWLPIDAILDRIGVGKTNDDGDEIVDLVLRRDADMLVERVERHAVTILPEAGSCEDCGSGKVPGVLYLSWISAARKAFALGYAIGSAVDDATGGALSDHVADKIGEWADYLDIKPS